MIPIQKQNVKKNRITIKFDENLRNAAHKEVVGEAHDAGNKQDRRQNDAADRNQTLLSPTIAAKCDFDGS